MNKVLLNLDDNPLTNGTLIMVKLQVLRKQFSSVMHLLGKKVDMGNTGRSTEKECVQANQIVMEKTQNTESTYAKALSSGVSLTAKGMPLKFVNTMIKDGKSIVKVDVEMKMMNDNMG